MGRHVFHLKDLVFSYGERPLFGGISLSVEKEDYLFVLGENGSGKSTLLKLICGILTPSSGTVSIDGRGLTTFRRRELASHVSFAGHEMPADFPLTVLDYASLGRFPKTGFFGTLGAEDRMIVERAMDMMDILPLKRRFLHELSAGERQRAILARAVAQDGKLLVLDEPSAHLDMRSTTRIFNVLKDLVSEGKTVIVSSHDANLTARYSRSVLILKGGKVIAHGQRHTVFTKEIMKEAFGVDVIVDVNPVNGSPRITIVG